MTSHGIARTVRTRTEEQRLQELDKIAKYRDLEAQLRDKISQREGGRDDSATRTEDAAAARQEAFQLTSRLLRLNPEYYTVWNDRRRLLTSGLLSGRSSTSSASTARPSVAGTSSASTSSTASPPCSSAATPPGHHPRTAGRSGATADDVAAAAPQEDAQPQQPHQNQQDADLQILRSELAFTVPLLLEFPKCYWIWNYRLWVLRQAIERLDVAVARRVWEEELGLASKMLTKDRRNFHAWGYRRHLVDRLESDELDGVSMVASEFEYTSKMIRVDLSNFSAWHHRSKLIPRLLRERGADSAARRSFFDSELTLIREALNVGPEDQSLWYYHQFLMLNLFEPATAAKEGSSSQPQPQRSPSSSSAYGCITPELSREERAAYVRREIDDVKDLLEDYDDIKWPYEALLEYTIALCRIEQRCPASDEMADLRTWLGKLRDLDPMRNGRWEDMKSGYGLG